MPATKYLGLMIDTKQTFWEQIRATADKASEMATNLSRLMANVPEEKVIPHEHRPAGPALRSRGMGRRPRQGDVSEATSASSTHGCHAGRFCITHSS